MQRARGGVVERDGESALFAPEGMVWEVAVPAGGGYNFNAFVAASAEAGEARL